MYHRVAISSGHGTHVAGAVGPEPWGLNEVDEARRVANQLAAVLEMMNVETTVFHDTTSKNQNDNLGTITAWHEEQCAELNISIHFNAFEVTEAPRGVEVLYKTQGDLAAMVSSAIASAGSLVDRGPKYRDDLYLLNHEHEIGPVILIEVCFVDSHEDADQYRANFNDICDAIAGTIAEDPVVAREEEDDKPVVRIAIEVSGDAKLSLTVNGLDVFLGTNDPD